MKPTVVDHIGVAVKDLQKALAFWENSLGIPCVGVEEVAEQTSRNAEELYAL